MQNWVKSKHNKLTRVPERRVLHSINISSSSPCATPPTARRSCCCRAGLWPRASLCQATRGCSQQQAQQRAGLLGPVAVGLLLPQRQVGLQAQRRWGSCHQPAMCRDHCLHLLAPSMAAAKDLISGETPTAMVDNFDFKNPAK